MIFWSPGITMSIIKHLFTTFSLHTILGRLCSIILSAWIWKFNRVWDPSFSSTESGTCSYHLLLHSRWNFLYSSQWIFFATLSRLLRYWFYARLGQSLMIWVTLPIFPLKSLQSWLWLVLSTLYFTEFLQLVFLQYKGDFQFSFQLSFPHPLLLLTFIVALCYPYKLFL